MACAWKTSVPASPEVAGSQGGFAEILRLEKLQGVLPGTICTSVGSTLSFPQHCHPLRPMVICLSSKSAFCLEMVVVQYRICPLLVFTLFPHAQPVFSHPLCFISLNNCYQEALVLCLILNTDIKSCPLGV